MPGFRAHSEWLNRKSAVDEDDDYLTEKAGDTAIALVTW